jgi:hypothetical protein
MRPKKHEATREGDLFRARLDQIIITKNELVQLAGKIDWELWSKVGDGVDQAGGISWG